MKWILGIFVIVIVISIVSGYKGGASKATTNYHSVMGAK